jgi:hypothetical protein
MAPVVVAEDHVARMIPADEVLQLVIRYSVELLPVVHETLREAKHPPLCSGMSSPIRARAQKHTGSTLPTIP